MLEENPKWKLLAQILGEITAEIEKDNKPPACVWGSRVLVLVCLHFLNTPTVVAFLRRFYSDDTVFICPE